MCLDDLLLKTFYQLTQTEKEFLLNEYQKTTTKQLCNNCIGSFIEAYNNLKKMAKKSTTATDSKCKYEFVPEFQNSEITVVNFGVVNAENLTDFIAENYLVNHPHIQLKAND